MQTDDADDRPRPFELLAGELLVGHCDTVWPVGTLRQMPVRVEGETLRVPVGLDLNQAAVGGASAVVGYNTAIVTIDALNNRTTSYFDAAGKWPTRVRGGDSTLRLPNVLIWLARS